jgi:hypothetical protein
MAGVLTLAQAKRLTEPFHSLWTDAHRYAERKWHDYRSLDPEAFLALSPLTRANFVREQAIRYVSTKGEGITPTDSLGFFAQIISGDVGTCLVRFKLLTDELRTNNHDSEQQDSLKLQQFSPEMMVQLSLDGVTGSPTLLTCGYQWNYDETEISRVLIVCHYNDRIHYYYDLEAGGGTEVLLLPGISEPPQPTIRSRQREDKKAEE